MKLTKEEKNVVIAGLYELQRNHKPGDDYDLYIQKIINKIQKENKKWKLNTKSTHELR